MVGDLNKKIQHNLCQEVLRNAILTQTPHEGGG